MFSLTFLLPPVVSTVHPILLSENENKTFCERLSRSFIVSTSPVRPEESGEHDRDVNNISCPVKNFFYQILGYWVVSIRM